MSTFKENYGIYKKFKPLYDKGLNDGEIARKLDCTRSAVCQWRSRNDLPSNYTHGTVRDKVLELYNQGYSKSEIVDKEISSYSYTMTILRGLTDNYPEVNNKAAIIGTLLGDGWVNKRPLFGFAHKDSHDEYTNYKKDRIDLSCNTYYEDGIGITGKPICMYKCIYHTHPYWEELRNEFYVNGNKIFPKDYLENYFNWESLAYWYLDDGYNHKSGCYIAINNLESQKEEITGFLNSTFNFSISPPTKNRLYIPRKDKLKMVDNIQPHVPDCMKYKIKPL
jgi:hypothetical protein